MMRNGCKNSFFLQLDTKTALNRYVLVYSGIQKVQSIN